MPDRTRAQVLAQRLLARPRLRSLIFRASDYWFRFALLPFRRRSLQGSSGEQPELVAHTDEYNRAAEDYFARHGNREFLLRKPFSDAAALPKHLIDAGVLIEAAAIAPGDTVLELGAGTCWLSHFLNRYGCATISVDVSASALALGEELFKTDAWTNWALGPRFVRYDGRRLPLGDESCDRVLVSDAFHHFPNQRQLLSEMFRVLKVDGVIAMSEPGVGHGSSAHSVEEASTWGVLENELVLEDVAALARQCGFAEVKVVIASPSTRMQVDAFQLGAFMGGRGFTGYWRELCASLEGHHYIVCYKARAERSTRRPSTIKAHLQTTSGGATLAARSGSPIHVRISVENTGDTTWLGGDHPRAGWTRLGAHLYKERGPDPRELVAYDWWRTAFQIDVAPRERTFVEADLPAISQPGTYVAVIEPVIEHVAWFSHYGVAPLELRIEVQADSVTQDPFSRR